MADSGGSGSTASTILQAKETFEIIQEISRLLNTGLDTETLAICVRLCESGVNPEALASVIRELRRESAAVKAGESNH
ncbi:mitotic-spindle organizing protein 1-like [Limulus polyphemus]|uniref:Mitotic-spindle organizing protein 1-like n=1 Tax=Limulus polyphemus TaxID=6850 RepID=A0ABM1C285_LIMPO|nr:mitotic-spindle organizing protein 1-like [Limulus polyphemus]